VIIRRKKQPPKRSFQDMPTDGSATLTKNLNGVARRYALKLNRKRELEIAPKRSKLEGAIGLSEEVKVGTP